MKWKKLKCRYYIWLCHNVVVTDSLTDHGLLDLLSQLKNNKLISSKFTWRLLHWAFHREASRLREVFSYLKKNSDLIIPIYYLQTHLLQIKWNIMCPHPEVPRSPGRVPTDGDPRPLSLLSGLHEPAAKQHHPVEVVRRRRRDVREGHQRTDGREGNCSSKQ